MLPVVSAIAHLERIRDLSDDLARELARPVRPTVALKAMASAIQQEIGPVLRILNRLSRSRAGNHPRL